MGNFKQTSNVSITITQEYTSRTSVNNEEAHSKQIVLSGHAMEEYKKYNYEFKTQYSGQKYRDVIWKNLCTGIKFDKTSMIGDQFWAGRVYKKKNCGKTTTYLESMTFAPSWRIHPDEIEMFLKSPENLYFEDIKNFLMTDEQFKDCIFLGFHIHMNEVYIPESITLEDGTERKLEEDERWNYAYIKPHMTVDYIPIVVEQGKEGTYRQLSRKKLWKSKEGRYNQSYAEFNTKKYEAVDKYYGFERGELYDDRKPEERPIKRSLEEYQKANDEARVQRLIRQQQKENEKAIKKLEVEMEQIFQQNDVIKEAQAELVKDIEDFMEEISGFDNINTDVANALIMKEERDIFIEMIDKLVDIIKPIEKIAPALFKRINDILVNTLNKIAVKEQMRQAMIKNAPYTDR